MKLEEINQKIDELKAEIIKLEQQKEAFFETKEVLNKIPINVRNALERNGILSDNQFLDFLEGRSSKANYIYQKAKTRKERLLSLRNVGEKYADITMKILKEINF